MQQNNPSVRWQPPAGLRPADIQAVIDATGCERDRLLLRCLWATGGRVSEVLALCPRDVQAAALVLPNRKNPGRPVKVVYLAAGDRDLPGALRAFAAAERLSETAPLFASAKPGPDGERRAIRRERVWKIVREASERAGVRVLALRPSAYGAAGEPAPLHPHLFRHARIRQILRHTKSLPLAQRQAGWATLQTAYLTLSDDEAERLMGDVPE